MQGIDIIKNDSETTQNRKVETVQQFPYQFAQYICIYIFIQLRYNKLLCFDMSKEQNIKM